MPKYKIPADKKLLDPVDTNNNWTARHKYLRANNLIANNVFIPLMAGEHLEFEAEDDEAAAKVCAYLKNDGFTFSDNKVTKEVKGKQVAFDYPSFLSSQSAKGVPQMSSASPTSTLTTQVKTNPPSTTQHHLKSELQHLKGDYLPLKVETPAPSEFFEMMTGKLEQGSISSTRPLQIGDKTCLFSVKTQSLGEFVNLIKDMSKEGRTFTVRYDDTGEVFAHSDGKQLYDGKHQEVTESHPLIGPVSDIAEYTPKPS